MNDNCFIDTNIWVYAFLASETDTVKQATALKLLENRHAESRIVVSAQVINEFHWTLSRKYGISDGLIVDKVEHGIATIAHIAPLDYSVYLNAISVKRAHDLSFWDSLIAASALQNGCSTLYTEDMSHGMTIEGKCRIVNPFI